MKSFISILVMIILVSFGRDAASKVKEANLVPFDGIYGNWAIEMPSGASGWLTLKQVDGIPQGELWTVGGGKRLLELAIKGNSECSFKRLMRVGEPEYPGGPPTGDRVKIHHEGVLKKDRLLIKYSLPNGKGFGYEGKRVGRLPTRPNLELLKFGKPIVLFNGVDLKGWAPVNRSQKNGWEVVDGELRNTTPKTDFSPYSTFGNLRTTSKFTDFNLKIDFNVPKGGNSGIYLRGVYEVQVVDRDSRMQGIQGVGSVFGRISPLENSGKPGGEWNSYDITLVDRHVTVILNDKKVIDNQPIEGCTNGALSPFEDLPGPIFLQGDHTSVAYRNIVLTPIVSTNQDDLKIAVMETAFNKRADASSFEDARRSGYNAIQMHSGMPAGKKIKKIPADFNLELTRDKEIIERWKEAALKHQVKVISLCAGSLNKCEIWGADRELAMRIAKQTIDACEALGVEIMLFPFFGPSKFQTGDETISGVADFMTELLPYAKSKKVVIGIEAPVTTERVVELLSRLDYPEHLKIYYDTGNLYPLEDIYESISMYGRQHFCQVHIKPCEAAVVGDGKIDLAKIAAALDEAQYDGWLVYEAGKGGKEPV
ncbi:MAG: family 16 glycoside hydrolase, partial [Mariniblastus sp.]